MQAEHPRRGGFIISPLGQVAPKPTKNAVFSKKKHRKTSVFESLSELSGDCAERFGSICRDFAKRALLLGISICCIWVLFSFFTFGTGIYYKGKLVAVSHNEKSYSEALNKARTYIASNDIKNADLHFQTVPTLTLRSNIIKGQNLRDNLLLCVSDMSRGCTVYSGDVPIFTAKDEATAQSVIKKHIAQCSVSENAQITTNLTYKPCIIEKNRISDFKKCYSLLAANENVSVVSVVNATSSQSIPFETHTTKDSTMYIGEFATVTEGKSGTEQIKAEVVYENGTEQSKKIISRKIIAEPVTQVVRVGTKPKDVLSSGLLYPLEGIISSEFGSRWGRMHEGIDIAVPQGTPVIAAECGTISFAGAAGGYGNLVKIDHGNGVITAYAHLSTIDVKVGQTVKSDTQIALSGNTGRSTGPHLHFEVVKNGTPLNPFDYLKKRQ